VPPPQLFFTSLPFATPVFGRLLSFTIFSLFSFSTPTGLRPILSQQLPFRPVKLLGSHPSIPTSCFLVILSPGFHLLNFRHSLSSAELLLYLSPSLLKRRLSRSSSFLPPGHGFQLSHFLLSNLSPYSRNVYLPVYIAIIQPFFISSSHFHTSSLTTIPSHLMLGVYSCLLHIPFSLNFCLPSSFLFISTMLHTLLLHIIFVFAYSLCALDHAKIC